MVTAAERAESKLRGKFKEMAVPNSLNPVPRAAVI